MIKINDLVKYGKFKEFIDGYNDKVEYNELYDIYLNDMLNNNKYDVLSLEQLFRIYNTCKENIDEEEFKKIEFGLFRKFPTLESYVKQSENNLENRLEAEEYLKNGIRFNYDNKYHVYVPCEEGVKCLVNGDIIGGCKTQEEIDFLVKCFKNRGILLEQYRDGDYSLVEELFKHAGIFDNQGNICFIYFDENNNLEEDNYFNNMKELTEDIDKKLMAKHNIEDLATGRSKINIKK